MPGARRTDASPERVHKREEEVLAAAAEVFHEVGYAEATVQDVADALGILKGSLYYYIDTKEDLLFRVLDDVHSGVDDLLERTRARHDPDPVARLSFYVRELTDFSLRNIERVTVYYHDIDRLSPERRRHIVARRDRHTAFVTELIAEAQGVGLIAAGVPARVLAYCLFGTVVWTYRWYRPAGRYGISAISDGCERFIIGGLQRAGRPTA